MNSLVSIAAVAVVVLLTVVALAAVGTGLAGLLGRLPGNGLLGVRTPETRRSPAAWTAANRAAGPGFLAAGLALLLGAAGLGLIGGLVGSLVVVVGVVAGLVLLNVAGLAGSRAAAVWQAEQEDDDAAAGGCCGGTTAEDSGGCSPDEAASCSPAAAPGSVDDPAADCGVGGGCGTCSLSGMCEPRAVGR